MSELSSKDAARGLSDVLSRVKFGNERIVLTRRGKPVCAIVTLGDLEHLEAAPAFERQRWAGTLVRAVLDRYRLANHFGQLWIYEPR